MPNEPKARHPRIAGQNRTKLPRFCGSNAVVLASRGIFSAKNKQWFARKRMLGCRWARTPAVIGLGMFALTLGLAAQAPPAVSRCGYKRWPVKIMADNDRGKVDLHPVETTIAELGNLRRGRGGLPQSNRLSPTEFKVYRIRGRLLRVRHEKDSDVHLLLEDPSHPESRMIAEIPAPECALGTGHEEAFRRAREVVRNMPLDSVVEVVGVGFFDYLHEQRGAASNGIELHPVLSIRLAQ